MQSSLPDMGEPVEVQWCKIEVLLPCFELLKIK